MKKEESTGQQQPTQPENKAPEGLTTEDKEQILRWRYETWGIDHENAELRIGALLGAEWGILYEREQSAQLRAEVERLQKINKDLTLSLNVTLDFQKAQAEEIKRLKEEIEKLKTP